MKKQNQGNKWGFIPFIIAVCLSLPFLAACSSEESVQNSTENAGNTYTFKVSEASNEDSITTRSTMKPQTVTRDLGNGMMLVGTLTDVSGSAATRATTTTQIADGTTITAYVCKSDGIITNVKTMTVSGSSLTIHCPNGSSTIYFLIGISPSASVGSNISSITTAAGPANWSYWHASATVPTSSDDLGTITFHHAFTEAKVTMSSGNGSTVMNGFSSTISGIANSAATLCANGTYTTTGNSDATINCTGSAGTGTSLSSPYAPFISTATGSSASATLTITQLIYGGNTYDYASGNTLTFNGIFAQGHKYNFNVTLQESYKKSFTLGDYYLWDAYASCATGTDKFESGNWGFNPTTAMSDVASHSCVNCPTRQEAMNYLAAGVYWDNGAELAGSTTPSYTLPDGNTYHTGLWLKKGANTGSATKTTAETPLVTASIRSGGEYFFLPAVGYYNSYSMYNTVSLSEAGTFGYYWVSTLGSGQNSYSFRFCKDYADVTSEYRQNAQGIWKVQ